MTIVDASPTNASEATQAPPTPRLRPTPIPPQSRRPSWSATWPWLLAATLTVFYAGVGLWMVFGIDYAIGDALARGAGARSIVHSRDQHVMGIGSYWMPLPTLAQAPFMAVLSRFGSPEAAVPITTAIAGGLTAVPLVATGRSLGLRDGITALIVLLYALNPYTVFFAASGMSEPWTALLLAVSMLYYVRWSRHHRTRDLGVLGLALAFTLLTKYEILGFLPPLVILVAAQAPRGRRLVTAAVVALPSVFAFVVWFAISVIVSGQTPFDVVFGASSGLVLENEGWLPEERNLGTSFEYVLRLTLLVAPGLLMLTLFSGVFRDLGRVVRSFFGRRRGVPSAPLLAAGALLPFAVFPGQVGAFLLRGSTFGNPRYFTPLILALAFVALVVAARARGKSQIVIVPIIAVACLAGYVTGFATMSNPKASKIEAETYVVDRLRGHDPRLDPTAALRKFRALTQFMDDNLGPDDLAALDSAVAHPMALLTSKPRQVVTDRDKDAEQLTARNPTLYTWMVVGTGNNFTSPMNSGLQQALNNPPRGSRWEIAAEGPTAQEWPMGSITLYRLVDAGAPSAPQSPTSAGLPS